MIVAWAIVDLMGHKRLAGLVSETELAGAKMLRIETPVWRPQTADWDSETVSAYFRAETVYLLTPCSEQAVQQYVKASTPVYSDGWRALEAPAFEGDFEIESERSTLYVNQRLDDVQESGEPVLFTRMPTYRETAAHFQQLGMDAIQPEHFERWLDYELWDAAHWAASQFLYQYNVPVSIMCPMTDKLRDLLDSLGLNAEDSSEEIDVVDVGS